MLPKAPWDRRAPARPNALFERKLIFVRVLADRASQIFFTGPGSSVSTFLDHEIPNRALLNSYCRSPLGTENVVRKVVQGGVNYHKWPNHPDAQNYVIHDWRG